MTPNHPGTPYTKVSSATRIYDGDCSYLQPCPSDRRQTTENILGILQEVEKRLREEMQAVENISWTLQPIIRPQARSKFTWRTEEDAGFNQIKERAASKSNHDDLESGDSFLIGGSGCVNCYWPKNREQSLVDSQTKNSKGECHKNCSCKELNPQSSRVTCACSNDDTGGTLDSSKRPLKRGEPVMSGHSSFQGHPDSLNSRGAPSSQFNSNERTNSTTWIIDAMHLLKEYYLKRAQLRLEVEPALQNALSVSVQPTHSPVVPLYSRTSNKSTQTQPVICEPIHTSPCGHFQWTATDEFLPDAVFYISPFDPKDIGYYRHNKS